LSVISLVVVSLASLILLIICLVIIKFRKAMAHHYARLNDISSEVFTSSLGEIEYLLQGKGPTVLISHGITGGVDQGIGLSKDYLGEGYQFLFVSRFGYLRSSKPDNASPKLQAQIYKELLDYLGIRKVFVFGNSAGSTSAIYFAIDYPETCIGLILVSPNAPLDVPSAHPPKFVFRFNLLYWFMMKLLGKWMLSMFVPKAVLGALSNKEISQLIDDLYFSALPVSERYEGIVFDLFVSNPSINDEMFFDRIGCPALIVNAVDDPATLISGARTLAKSIKDSELYTFATGGHLILGHKEEIRQKTSDFISSNS
jgi:pimeloyl-ACP methyl ester carboxylesterase